MLGKIQNEMKISDDKSGKWYNYDFEKMICSKYLFGTTVNQTSFLSPPQKKKNL